MKCAKVGKLEKVGINDVMPLKGTRHDAILNLKYSGALRHQ